MKSFCISLFLIPLILSEVFTAHVPYHTRGYGQATLPVQPLLLVAAGNPRSGPNSPIIPPENDIPEQVAVENEEYEPNSDDEEDEGDSALAGYIPITAGNGETYLVPESGISSIEDPEMMENLQGEQEEENEIFVPTGSMEIYGTEIFDSKTGETSILLPEEIISNLGENDVIALVENPEESENSRKLIIRRRRRRPYGYSVPMRRPQVYHKAPRPYRPLPPPPPMHYHYRGAQRKGALIKFGPVRIIAYMGGRRRILFD